MYNFSTIFFFKKIFYICLRPIKFIFQNGNQQILYKYMNLQSILLDIKITSYEVMENFSWYKRNSMADLVQNF